MVPQSCSLIKTKTKSEHYFLQDSGRVRNVDATIKRDSIQTHESLKGYIAASNIHEKREGSRISFSFFRSGNRFVKEAEHVYTIYLTRGTSMQIARKKIINS